MDVLAEQLNGGPLNGWWIVEAQDFDFDQSFTYTFAIEMRSGVLIPAKMVDLVIVSMWALYDYKDRRATFREVAWRPPTDCVVVEEIRQTAPWR